jgi:CheY-like chemotaxis protein
MTQDRGKKRGGLLLVENYHDDVLFFKRELGRVRPGTPLEFVTDGAAAVQALSADGPPALVILDLKLPRKSGLEVLEWMTSQPGLKSVRTVVLTSSSEEVSLRRATALGAVCCVVKPVEFARLRDVVAAIVEYWAEPGEASLARLGRHAAAIPAES